MSILTFDRVSYQYPGEDFNIVDRLSFDVLPGACHCILASAAAGKAPFSE